MIFLYEYEIEIISYDRIAEMNKEKKAQTRDFLEHIT